MFVYVYMYRIAAAENWVINPASISFESIWPKNTG